MPKITVKSIEAAKPKDKPYQLVADQGLYLNVPRTGIKTWSVRYRIDGKQQYAVLPLPYGNGKGKMSLAEACIENARIQGLARQGIDFKTQDKLVLQRLKEERSQEETKNRTFFELFETWLADGVSRKDDNAELRRTFNKDVLPYIGNKRVCELVESDIRRVLQKVVKDRGSNRVAVILHTDILQLFSWAEDRQPWRKLLIEGNPAKTIDIRQIISPEYEDIKGYRDRWLSEDEICELRGILALTVRQYEEAPAGEKRSMPRPLPERSQLAIWICLSTLCRIGELLMAEWKNVNFKTGEWLIPKASVKSTRGKKQDLIVFLSPFATKKFQALYSLTGSTKWLFPNEDGSSHIYIKTVTRQISDRQVMFKDRQDDSTSKRKYDNSLVLSHGEKGDWIPHDLRRTGATMMQKLKIVPDIIDRCQNHVINTSANKARRHYQLYDYADEKKEAWFKWGEYLENILS